MIHATRIRLFLDFGIQFILFIVLFVQLILNPSLSDLLHKLSLFGILLLSWQITHAVYVVRKYKDWHRKQYLSHVRQLLAYGLLVLFVGLFMTLISFGFLIPFFYFTLYIFHWTSCLVVLFLAIQYFRISCLQLYHHLYKPRSFWDIK